MWPSISFARVETRLRDHGLMNMPTDLASRFSRKFSPGVNGILRQIKRLSHFGVSSEWLHGD